MADEQLLNKIHSLSDLELAALLCLISREHCLISTEPDSVDELAEELRLVASKTFNLDSAIVSCHARITLDEFATGLLVHPFGSPPSPSNTRSVSPYRPRHEQPHLSSGVPASTSGSYFSINPSPRIGGPISPASPSIGGLSSSQVVQPRIANVVLAKDLNRAPRAVQIQALELLRTRRIFTRTSVQTAPKQFLFIGLVGASSGGQARVTPHLNDFFYIGHWHDPEEDGFPYLDSRFNRHIPNNNNKDDLDDTASTVSSSSVVKLSLHPHSNAAGLGLDPKWLAPNNSTTSISSNNNTDRPQKLPPPEDEEAEDDKDPLFTETEISHLSQLARTSHTPISITRYQANLVAFLRTHRAVAGGITPTATRHLDQLAKSLAPLHGIGYVTPSLVALALRKVYLHRIEVVRDPQRERSVQWGSEVETVRAMLEGVGAEDVVEDTLELVKVPV
ncbi:hypothetical protein N657DRAFT_641893 [Parathielavia appendiculata]|uniref:magnesium chelatase n=1 Tax=Parathielavia appendiculata TaxID=2587402 RepID=A0AAN6U8I7_9PEZI|nr:hypothetical protein N657DRAFT_641893 [Parathielavia appendiculata]